MARSSKYFIIFAAWNIKLPERREKEAVQTINEDTIRRINQGDAKAFEQLYNSYYVYLSAVATKFLYSAETAEEIVNDVFLGVWNHRERITYPVGSYLVRAVRNRCMNYLRERRLEEVPLSDVQDHLLAIQEQMLEAEPYPLARLEAEDFERTVASAVDRLPTKCRDIFRQYLYHHKTYDEIALHNRISPSTVRVQIKIGLDKLRAVLGDRYVWLLLLYPWLPS